MLALYSASTAFAPALNVQAAPVRTVGVKMETAADLVELSKKCNPSIGFYDPLGFVQIGVDKEEESTTIGWLRHAEIKHGRVAMAAFVGFIAQSNGAAFPWALTTSGTTFSDISAAGGPGDQWDALPTAAKMQIICAVGVLEGISEFSPWLEEQGQKHYVRGGKPGFYPALTKVPLPHPVPLDLWDPFGLTKKMTEERKAKSLVAEINNGRLAMIGIFGMLSASKGLQVPGLDSIEGITAYSGEYMAPFTAADTSLPLVDNMLGMGSFLF